MGWVPWQPRRGAWDIRRDRLRISTSAVNPVVLLNVRFADVEIELDTSRRSGDAIVFRATDEENYLRLSNHYEKITTEITETRYSWGAAYTVPHTQTVTEYEWHGYWAASNGHHDHLSGYPPNDPAVAEFGWRWSQSDSVHPFGGAIPHQHSHLIPDASGNFTIMSTHTHPFSHAELSGWTRERELEVAPAHRHFPSMWGTSGSTSPHPTTLTHSHGSYNTHAHTRNATSFYGETREVVVGTTTTIERQIYLDRVENGQVTNIDSWDINGDASKLRVIAEGDQVTVFGQDGQAVGATVTVDFNEHATFHGVGRRQGGIQGTALDNFRLVVL